MDPHRYPTAVNRTDKRPFYPANIRGQDRVVLPTLMAFPQSRAFRLNDGQPSPGCIWDVHTNAWTEPNPDERERALGYSAGTTNVPGVTHAERHTITGNCMDQRALSGLLHLITHTTRPEWQCPHWQTTPVHEHLAPSLQLGTSHAIPASPVMQQWDTHLGSMIAAIAAASHAPKHGPPDHSLVCAAMITGNPRHAGSNITPQAAFKANKALTRQAREPGQMDIHLDKHTMHLLRTGTLHPGSITPAQVLRVTRRAHHYKLHTPQRCGRGAPHPSIRRHASRTPDR